MFCLEDIGKNVTIIIKLTPLGVGIAVDKIASYIQMVWRMKLIFKIQIFRLIVILARYNISFWKMAPCIFKYVLKIHMVLFDEMCQL